MASRWFNVATVLLWVASMSWLVIATVLPPLLVGEPPTYQQILSKPDEKVIWSIRWDDAPVGMATSWTDRSTGDMVQMHSDVKLDRIPWQRRVGRLPQPESTQPRGCRPVGATRRH